MFYLERMNLIMLFFLLFHIFNVRNVLTSLKHLQKRGHLQCLQRINEVKTLSETLEMFQS